MPRIKQNGEKKTAPGETGAVNRKVLDGLVNSNFPEDCRIFSGLDYQTPPAETGNTHSDECTKTNAP